MKNSLLKIWHSFFEKWLIFRQASFKKEPFSLHSEALQRQVHLQTFVLKPAYSLRPLSLLLLNDGQDFSALRMESLLQDLHQENALVPLLVVGIAAGDRMQEYGTAGQPDYAGRGAKADAYTQFVLQELMPFLQQHFSFSPAASHHAFAGFSLGGLSAMDIVWNHPEVFQQVGVFSGALWWRSSYFDHANPDADRIIHQRVAEGAKRPGMRFWLQTGTHDETADRNNNGIIDAIDDTLDLITALEQIGYQEEEITYVEVERGEHNPQTWGKVMPDFLRWCFGR